MPLILGTNSIKDTGYTVANSVRFNDGDSPRLRIANPTAGTRTKGTFSTWFKRGTLGGEQTLFSTWDHAKDGYDSGIIVIQNDNRVSISNYDPADGSGTHSTLIAERLFRDCSAWYHVVFAWDSTQGTAADRYKIYVNGVRETVFNGTPAYPSSSQNLHFNVGGTANPQHIGYKSTGSNSSYFDGYLAETVHIEGSALDASSFGEFDEDSPNIWKPKDVSGLTFGDEGFYLDYEDSGDLGDDESGNGNDFAETNLAATDQTTDTPTNSFCTMNPLDNYYAGNTYSEGNIKFQTKTSGGFAYGTPTVALSSGKWYVEFDCIASDDDPDYHQVGIKDVLADAATGGGANIGTASGETGDSWGYMSFNGTIRNDGYTSYGDSWAPGDIIGVYLDLDNNKLYFSKNGTIQNSGTGISITDPASTKHGYYYITAGGMSTNAYVTFEANFGNPYQALSSAVADANGYGQFEYDPSDGGSSSFDSAAKDFLAICTKNLGSDGG
jgi:hypothetical protein